MLVIFLWLIESDRFHPAEEEPASDMLPPGRQDDSAIINIADDTVQPGLPAQPDHTAVPDAADSIIPPDTVPTLRSAPDDTMSAPANLSSLVPPGKLQIPVAGINEEELYDTYNDARSEGRVHNAIDIIAPQGTPVLATTDGKIVKLFQSEKGGITIYQLDPNQRVIYYYAHLDRYADGLAEGQIVTRGDVIGYVGNTGNAGEGNYHLHFGISIVDDPRQFWGGTPVNPYPLLKGGEDRGQSGR